MHGHEMGRSLPRRVLWLLVLVLAALTIQISAAVAQGVGGIGFGPLGPDTAWASSDDDDNNGSDHDDDDNGSDDDDDDDNGSDHDDDK